MAVYVSDFSVENFSGYNSEIVVNQIDLILTDSLWK